ncbi:MAG: hypothetical protein ACU84H_10560 [Gammaproteobacteria bacterium]
MYLTLLLKSLVNGLLKDEPVFGNLLNEQNCNPTLFAAIAECDKKYEEHDKPVTRFVGLENLEPENFQLQGWGDVEKGTTFTKRFAKGDVLFGKRRAYLKKVAVADFDGICSNYIFSFPRAAWECSPGAPRRMTVRSRQRWDAAAILSANNKRRIF